MSAITKKNPEHFGIGKKKKKDDEPFVKTKHAKRACQFENFKKGLHLLSSLHVSRPKDWQFV